MILIFLIHAITTWHDNDTDRHGGKSFCERHLIADDPWDETTRKIRDQEKDDARRK